MLNQQLRVTFLWRNGSFFAGSGRSESGGALQENPAHADQTDRGFETAEEEQEDDP